MWPSCPVYSPRAPCSPQHEALGEIWRKALNLPLPGLTAKSNFFDFGGSLQFVKLAATIKEELDLTIPLGDLLKAPTLAGVAETINASKGVITVRL